ncbi:uncharacterized protein BYT42DRAFT_492517 [Radiomyces spectabilis]|uniref:uncharacterized protein n=1 Tax=Radiomyces spectabilis TaxID=64574 RepID=UPI00222127E3|nr:uncharacterized protein BYT42DRAFT_492517 [Radiomyces spectabilis]KAI8384611.1 hypothetical protein BYT42DRAFT_492517 [Radiomyces spectabilis]
MLASPDTQVQKPDTIDTQIYEKPNAYDDDDPIAANENREEAIAKATNLPSPPPPYVKHPKEYDALSFTSSLLSHATPTTQTTFTEDVATPSRTSSMSLSSSEVLSPSTSSMTSASEQTKSSLKSSLLNRLRKRSKEDMITFEIRKRSLTKPHMHDFYFSGTKMLAYRKMQPHSYSWGFQNILYRTVGSERQDDGTKVAETRRRAFHKDITVEWGDYDAPSLTTHELINKAKSHLLFVYESQVEEYRIRWRRPNLLSHDMICEIKKKQTTPAPSGERIPWRPIAEFDSHGMGYLIQIGKLVIDRQALSYFQRPDYLEAHLVILCSTFVDLMREVVEKAVGLGNGGVAGSE